ncbi:MAG: type III pantothenate kinase [Nitriliruptor sp.]|nr:MAG: type III pantothenate kinase [Nitriliruptor sp.]
MLLAVDVGNSSTVLGLFSGEQLHHRWTLSTSVSRTSDEYTLMIAGLLGRGGLQLDADVTGVVIGSVVPTVTERLRALFTRELSGRNRPIVIEPGVRTGVVIRHDHPQDLGADRIANAVAVSALYGGPAIVVDLGTAISFDAVDATGAFIGGAIAPGVMTAAEGLVERAARLPTVEPIAPASPVGRSTTSALQSGIVYGAAAMVDGMVSRISLELGQGVTTVATGETAGLVLEHCGTIDHHDPALTLKGLRLVWERNVR